MVARCETVLNTTMAEMETYHTQKIEDFGAIAREHLDGEIEFYEQVNSFRSRPLFEKMCERAASVSGAKQISCCASGF